MGIGGVGFPKLGAHPLLLLAELEPEHDEENDESHKSAHLGERDRRAKEPGQHAGVDGVTDHCVGPGGDQFVALLNRDGLAPVATQVLSRPDGEQKAGDHDGSSQPEGPKPSRPGLKIEPAQRDASCREQDDRDQEGDRAQDARGHGLETLGGFRVGGFDPPVDDKGDPENGKERLVEPEHAGPPGARCYAVGPGEFQCLARVLAAPTLSATCSLAALIGQLILAPRQLTGFVTSQALAFD